MKKQIVDINRLDNHVDDYVDKEIRSCLLRKSPQSFFMFAGAGSGKTRSLINALEFLDEEIGVYLATHAKKVAVITYTNAACDEIRRRLQYKPIFFVSTIHSFLWEIIKNYQLDIKEWLISSINSDLCDLLDKQSKDRARRAVAKKEGDIEKKRARLKKVEAMRRFSYSPNEKNIEYDSLNHNDIIKIGCDFITKKETMQGILVAKYPILLIDESQDTKKELVDALLCVYEKHKSHFTIGMFGDTMQKIYMDGKDNLEKSIPGDWACPVKIMNHRSAKRIVALANVIRDAVDEKKQQPRSDAIEGLVHLFIAKSSSNKNEIEKKVADAMSVMTNDLDWGVASEYKSLILEHHMAASRFLFNGVYVPLNESGVFDTALRDGSIMELSFLSNIIAPLVKAHKNGNISEIAKIISLNSPLLNKKLLADQPIMQLEKLNMVKVATDSLLSLWDNNVIPSCLDVLRNICSTRLFVVGERISDILDDSYSGESKEVIALKKALAVPFDELERYSAYVTGQTRFATHHGIKGLEFPRVMVILDDAEAKGNSFSYEKLFGVRPKTEIDLKNEREGRDNSLMRTARLFYVACTRAQKSLAVLFYTENCEAIKRTALSHAWFSENEISLLSQ